MVKEVERTQTVSLGSSRMYPACTPPVPRSQVLSSVQRLGQRAELFNSVFSFASVRVLHGAPARDFPTSGFVSHGRAIRENSDHFFERKNK